MMVNTMPSQQSRLLAQIPPGELQRLMPLLERVPLRPRRTLSEGNVPITHAYFIESGVVCACSRPRHESAVEIAMVGNMGMVGVPLLLDSNRSPYRSVVQIGGSALRMAAPELGAAMGALPGFRRILMRYVLALMVQQSQVLVCNARHKSEQRIARWLLMAHDRVAGATLPVTQSLIARMLGVRRPTVTDAVARLEHSGCLSRARGSLSIVDRPRLERSACDCYGVIAAEYRLISLDNDVVPAIADEGSPQRATPAPRVWTIANGGRLPHSERIRGS
jgi:CRP-like cAMP-binding protein